VSESILLADTDLAAVRDAVALLDGWRAEPRSLVELPAALGESGVRALLLTHHDVELVAVALGPAAAVAVAGLTRRALAVHGSSSR